VYAPNAVFDQTRASLAQRVRALRAERGLSQEALAHEAGIDRTYQSQIERGVGNPSLKVLCAIAEVLEIELESLLRAP
jgi:transcriptional regulator with XRE-family HTH domain